MHTGHWFRQESLAALGKDDKSDTVPGSYLLSGSYIQDGL
jgi:hypothetical protein